MPRNSGGTYVLPAGNPVVTGTTITSTWANGTLSDIAAELTNSLARDGSGSMDATLLLPNGAAAAPALSFASQTTTGLYLDAASDMRLQVNATNAIKMTPTEVSIPLGLVVTQDTTDGSAVVGTGNGAGYGGDFNGGGPNGTALRGTGVGSGNGATFIGGLANGRGVDATGQGANQGVRGTGGASSGAGVRGYGGAPNGIGAWGVGAGTGVGVIGEGGPTSGIGVYGAGGASSGPGVSGLGGATNGIGIRGTGSGTGSGVDGTGGATSGAGGAFTGGAPNGHGVVGAGTAGGAGVVGTGGNSNAVGVAGNGTGTAAAVHGEAAGTGAGVFGRSVSGPGVYGIGGAGLVGGQFSNGTASTSVAPQNAASLINGNLSLAGVANPAATTGFSNTLTPKNIIKAWGYCTTNGAGGVTLSDGFNISSVAVAGATIIVTFQTAMIGINFAVFATPVFTVTIIPVGARVVSKSPTTVTLAAHKESGTNNITAVNFASEQVGMNFMVMGEQ